MAPAPPKPMIISAQVPGSGTAAARVMVGEVEPRPTPTSLKTYLCVTEYMPADGGRAAA